MRVLKQIIPFFPAAGLFVYELFHFSGLRPWVDHLFPWLALVYLGAIVSHLWEHDRPITDRAPFHYIARYANGNPYVEALIRCKLEELRDNLEGTGFEARSEDESCDELVRAVDLCQKGDSVFGISYRVRWLTTFDPYQKATLNARKRGVTVNRIFIIPDEQLSPCEDAYHAWEAMKQQAQAGATVRYVEEHKIRTKSSFLKHAKGMVEFQYGNESLVMTENASNPNSEDCDRPFLVTVSWYEPKIEKERDHFKMVDGLNELQDVSPHSNRPDPPWMDQAASAP